MPESSEPSILSGKGADPARGYTTAVTSKFETPGLTASIKEIAEITKAVSALRKELAGAASDPSSKSFFSQLYDQVTRLRGGMAAGGTGAGSGAQTVWQNMRAKATTPGGGAQGNTGQMYPGSAPGGPPVPVYVVDASQNFYAKVGGGAGGSGGSGGGSGGGGNNSSGASFYGNSGGAGGPGGGAGGGGGGGGGGSGGGGGMFGRSMSALGDSTLGGLMSMNDPLAKGFGALAEGITSLMMKPIQLAYNRVEENRDAALTMSEYLGPTANRMGVKSQDRIEQLIGILSESIPIRGSMKDILGATDQASRMGFTVDDSSGRSGGFFGAARQFQMMNPSVAAPDIVMGLGNQMSKGVQRQVMLTGGAFSMQGPGGTTKTLQQWAEGILRFFEGQRPGDKRGKPFTKEELETQHFPGSNIDAWFRTNQVEEYMQDAFWQYAMTKAAYSGSSQGTVDFDTMFGAPSGGSGGPGNNNIAMERLRGLSNQARRDFTLASSENVLGGGSTYKHYATRERTDAGFQTFLSQTLDSMLGQLAGPLGQAMDKIPTSIADMLYKLLTKTGPTVVGAGVQALTGMSVAGFSLGGDPGYVGTGGGLGIGDARGDDDYGPAGSGMSHLTPSMQSRVGAMMRDNPQIKIVSGHRDGGTQERLRRKGVGNLAPTGHSSHSQGVSADLGPSSQYDWIAKNAHKYGLDSAAHHGEKWHVGMPGTVPVFGNAAQKMGGIGDTQRTQNSDGTWTISDSDTGSSYRVKQMPDGSWVDMATGAPVPSGGGLVPDWVPGSGLINGAADAAKTGAEWLSAITAMVGGNFGPLMAKIQEFNPIGTLGKGLFSMLSSSMPGLSKFNPFTGDYGEGGSGVESAANGGPKGYWKDPTSAGGDFFSNSVSSAIAAAGNGGGVTVGQNFAGGSAGVIKQIARQKVQAKGWNQYWNDLDQLVMHESGWNPTAQNPSSSAYGLFQFMDKSRGGKNDTWALVGGSKTSDPSLQIDYGLKYIEKTYGNPSAAWSKWQSRSPHWYEMGGTHFNGPQIIGVGEGPEVTIPLNKPDRLKSLTDAYIRPNYPGGLMTGTTGGNTTRVEVHMPIELKVQVTGNASSGDLREVSRVLATQVEQDLADVVARHA